MQNQTKFQLLFEGYWLESDKQLMPDARGVYCAYGCDVDSATGTRRPRRLLFISDCLSARNAAFTHERMNYLHRFLAQGERLGYAFASIDHGSRQASEALAFRHKPPANSSRKFSFPFELTQVSTEGRAAFLDPVVIAPDLAPELPIVLREAA
jgi:hypothetical protein